MLATPDRLATGHDLGAGVRAYRPLELKTDGGGYGYGTTGTDTIPLHYTIQLTQQMRVAAHPDAGVAAPPPAGSVSTSAASTR
ncbi:MAG TPA: hypothetical protein VF054_06670 [Micromonosporaceae bacterium]